MSFIGNARNLSTANNVYAIPGRVEIIEKIETANLCAFQKDKLCLLPTNKYRQNDSSFSLAEQFTFFSQDFNF